ncbi:MAG: CoA transferase, partial [Dehalococcoidia bacterium]
QVMEQLQHLGVPAGPVLNARQLLTNPHLRARGFYESTDHPPETGLGIREYIGRGWKLSDANLHIQGPGPMLGEGNEYVLGTLLGLSGEEIGSLREEGVIGETLQGAVTPSSVSLDRQQELGWIVQHDPQYREHLESEFRDRKSTTDRSA